MCERASAAPLVYADRLFSKTSAGVRQKRAKTPRPFLS
jgi:hypothetical protein